jgi:hypothetical protein
VLLKILKYDIVRDVAARDGEGAPSPEMPPQERLRNSENSSASDVMSVRTKVAERNMRRDFHQHRDMFSRQRAGDDLYAQVFALAAEAFGES